MASEGPRSLASFLLVVNLIMYFIITLIAGWALNYAIQHSHSTASYAMVPAGLFPMYYPLGNMATGFYVIFALIAGLVGIASSVSGLTSVLQWDAPNLLSAASFSILTWALTLLAMGLACKEIDIGPRTASLITLETLTIILSGSQLFCAGAIHIGAMNTVSGQTNTGGRV